MLHNCWKRRHYDRLAYVSVVCQWQMCLLNLQSSKEIGLAVEKLDAKSKIIEEEERGSGRFKEDEKERNLKAKQEESLKKEEEHWCQAEDKGWCCREDDGRL